MLLSELKRAVEDVVLRPEENQVHVLEKRATIAALDLCRPENVQSTSQPSAAAMNTCGCSQETVPLDEKALCASTSLDTIVTRPQPLLHRHSAGASRRQSRVLNSLHRRKRSNSLTNYHKSQAQSLPPSARQTPLRFNDDHTYRSSLGSSESHSSVARSDDFSQDYVPEEEEGIGVGQLDDRLHIETSLFPSRSPALTDPSRSPIFTSSHNGTCNSRSFANTVPGGSVSTVPSAGFHPASVPTQLMCYREIRDEDMDCD